MRLIAPILVAIIAAGGAGAAELDLSDHQSLCAEMAKAHEWSDGSDAVANCPCSMAELQSAMSPNMFETTIRWQLDPSSLDANLAEDMDVSAFYDAVGPVFGAVEAKCGPMR